MASLEVLLSSALYKASLMQSYHIKSTEKAEAKSTLLLHMNTFVGDLSLVKDRMSMR